MKKILFEDASNTPSSVLLNSSVYGENIYFSEGCSKILDKCISIMNPDDTIYILYDVSPRYLHASQGARRLDAPCGARRSAAERPAAILGV